MRVNESSLLPVGVRKDNSPPPYLALFRKKTTSWIITVEDELTKRPPPQPRGVDIPQVLFTKNTPF
jgi:hypothetical protein